MIHEGTGKLCLSHIVGRAVIRPRMRSPRGCLRTVGGKLASSRIFGTLTSTPTADPRKFSTSAQNAVLTPLGAAAFGADGTIAVTAHYEDWAD